MNTIKQLQQATIELSQAAARAARGGAQPADSVDIYVLERRLEDLARTRLQLYAAAGVGR